MGSSKSNTLPTGTFKWSWTGNFQADGVGGDWRRVSDDEGTTDQWKTARRMEREDRDKAGGGGGGWRRR